MCIPLGFGAPHFMKDIISNMESDNHVIRFTTAISLFEDAFYFFSTYLENG